MRGFVLGARDRAEDFILGRDSRRIVFRAEGCGLANRLRALVGYQALARLCKLPFCLTWAVDSACPSEFRDLFDSAIDVMYPQDLRSVSPRAIYREPIWFEDIWKRGGRGFDWLTYLREVQDVNEGGDVAAQIEQRVQFDGGLGRAEHGPRKYRQTQIDGRGESLTLY